MHIFILKTCPLSLMPEISKFSIFSCETHKNTHKCVTSHPLLHLYVLSGMREDVDIIIFLVIYVMYMFILYSKYQLN